MTQETERQRTELRELEARVNRRIADANSHNRARFNELSARGEARDAELYAQMRSLARMEAREEYRLREEAREEYRRNALKETVPILIGIAVAAAAIIAGLIL